MGGELTTDSRFEVNGLLGQGGCATVYRAVDHGTGARVALKLLSEGRGDHVSVARLSREARAAQAINHPNVCRVLAWGQLDDGRPYVAMELLEGETLRDYLRRRGPLSVEEAIEIGAQMLSGLEAAHGLGLVHRDVKPENVIVFEQHGRPCVKILDFGLCRRSEDPVDERTLTLQGSVVGTPGYLAPEQVRGGRAIDPRLDLFAVGLVLFEMLTGERAYKGKNAIQLMGALLTKRVPALRSIRADLPAPLEWIIAHAVEQDPRVRYATAAHFLHDLLEARTTIRREAAQKRARVLAGSSSLPTVVGPRGAMDWNAPTRRLSGAELDSLEALQHVA